MDSYYGQLNFGLNVYIYIYIYIYIEAQEETKAHGTDKLYKVKVDRRFEHIMFASFIYDVVNGVLLWLDLHLVSISKSFSVKLIIRATGIGFSPILK